MARQAVKTKPLGSAEDLYNRFWGEGGVHGTSWTRLCLFSLLVLDTVMAQWRKRLVMLNTKFKNQ